MSRSIAAAVLAAGAIGVALELARVDSPARRPLVLLFLVAAPALAFAGLMRGADGFARLIVGGTAAIVVNSLVAIVMLTAGVWSARAGLLAVAVISTAGLIVQLSPAGARLAGSRPAEAGEPEPGAGGHDPGAVAPEPGDVAPSQASPFRRGRRKGARRAAVTDEATVQMSAVHSPAVHSPAAYPPAARAPAPAPAARVHAPPQGPPGEDAATVQMPAFSRDRSGAVSRTGSHGPTTGGPTTGGPPTGGAATSHAPDGRPDQARGEDDATQQFPAVRRED
jgi:hypothetical protein